MTVKVQVKDVPVNGYSNLEFYTDRWTCKIKDADIKDMGETLIGKAIKGKDYMTYAVNEVMKKIKFITYKNDLKYDPLDFKEFEEVVITIIDKIKQLTEFDQKANIIQQKEEDEQIKAV